MRRIDWALVVDDKGLALMTLGDLSGNGEMYLADFRDTQALAYAPTKHFVGLSRTRGLRLGGHPLRLVDGIWYITEDTSTNLQDVQVSDKEFCLQPIR